MYVGIHVRCVLLFYDFNRNGMGLHILIQHVNVRLKFHVAAVGGSRVFPLGRTE